MDGKFDPIDVEELTPVQNEIVSEIIKAIGILGGKNDLTVALCSWGDTLPQVEVLSMLKQWNRENQ